MTDLIRTAWLRPQQWLGAKVFVWSFVAATWLERLRWEVRHGPS